MAEVAIKEHTRRGKGGKTVHVRGYTRRVGHKGVHSPKRERKKDEGKEFEEKVNEKKQEQQPQMSPEELKEKLKERREWEEDARLAEKERKSLGMSKEKYSFYKVQQQKKQQKAPKSSHTKNVHKPLSPKGSQTILDRVEDKIAEFINKYSKKKYKKYL
jgi:hypothetical protein